MTSGLFSGGETVPAYRSAELGGHVRIAGDPRSLYGYALTQIRNGDRAIFRSAAPDGEGMLILRVRSDKPCRAELLLGGQYAGCASVSPSEEYGEVALRLEKPAFGPAEAEVRFYGDGFTAALDSFRFA